MALTNFFSAPEAVEKPYLTIVLTKSYVQSAVWKIGEGINIQERSDRHAYTDEKDCIVQTDLSLQELGKDSEAANEVVFGLEPDWVNHQGISDQYKPLLKKITQDLSLKAVGFVVINEAVFQHVVKTQAQLNALLLELQKEQLRVSLVKQGKLLATEKVGRSGDIAADLAEGLARFNKAAPALTQLPSKVVLYSYDLTEDELANEEQAILHHDWVADKTFLQPPLIEIMASTAVLDAVVLEGGVAVSTTTPASTAQATRRDDQVNEEQSNVMPTTASSFGIPFAAAAVAPMVSPAINESDNAVSIPAESDGAPTGIAKQRRLPSLPHFHFGLPGHHKWFILAGFGLGLLVLVLGSYIFLRTTAQATLALELATRPVAREVALILDPEATTASETTLPVTRVTREVSGSKTMATTGVKEIGDNAKGKVTLLNKTTSPKTFAAGTVLSSGDLQFTLDQEVTVASASVSSSGTTETKTFGQADGAITASAIGTESNLGKDTTFQIESFDQSTYAATNPEPLTGGSSREVRVASQQDQQKLLADLRADLLTQAQTDFRRSDDGSQLVPSGRVTMKTTNYTADVGDEVNEFGLNATAVIEAYAYQNDLIKPLAEQLLANQVPAEYELDPETIQILSDTQLEGASNSAKVTLNANLTSQAKPKIDLNLLKQEIAGLSLAHLASIIAGRPEITDYVVQFQPSIAQQILRALPPGDRLHIEIK